MRSQYNLLLKIAAFTQVYPELTPRDCSFAEWLVHEWFPQVAWVESVNVKVPDSNETK